MELLAPAKINLFLNTGKKREDGFHEFLSVMIKVSLFDKITVSESDEISVTGFDSIGQEENIVWKAATLLKDKAGVKKGCTIKLEKNIPVGGGLGGGSSDAAAVIKALNGLWQLDLDKAGLEEAGSELGSDVEFFLTPGGCIASGRGEQIEPLHYESEKKKNIVLIDPGISITTKKVYGNYPGGRLTAREELDKIKQDYTDGNWSLILRNDLEDTVFREYPVLKDLKNRLGNWGAQPLLSGSGACLFALVEERKLAESISGIIQNSFGYRSWIVSEV